MPPACHLLIAYARADRPACREALAGLRLPALRQLLSRLRETTAGSLQAPHLSMPHEHALAQALGLPHEDGRIPWAAWELGRKDAAIAAPACAWITPCAWEVARDHIGMHDPARLQLTEAQSRELLAAMAPYFAEDGIGLDHESPTRWLARGDIFEDLACASLDRVAGAHVDDWLPRGPQARVLRRLQQEMQMLLYTHPVNEARERAGLSPVNSFWVSGAGRLPADPTGRGFPALPPHLQVDDSLREPALQDDARAWAARWEAIDSQRLTPLLAQWKQGLPVALTLCGERSARTWGPPASRWRDRLAGFMHSPSVPRALDPL